MNKNGTGFGATALPLSPFCTTGDGLRGDESRTLYKFKKKEIRLSQDLKLLHKINQNDFHAEKLQMILYELLSYIKQMIASIYAKGMFSSKRNEVPAQSGSSISIK